MAGQTKLPTKYGLRVTATRINRPLPFPPIHSAALSKKLINPVGSTQVHFYYSNHHHHQQTARSTTIACPALSPVNSLKHSDTCPSLAISATFVEIRLCQYAICSITGIPRHAC